MPQKSTKVLKHCINKTYYKKKKKSTYKFCNALLIDNLLFNSQKRCSSNKKNENKQMKT